MNTLEAYKKLEEIEKYIIRESPKESNYLWPVLKSWLWEYFLYKDNEKYKFEEIKKYIKKPILGVFNSFFNFIFYLVLKNNKETKILFFCRRIHERKISNGSYFDRLVDPLILLLNNSVSIRKFTIDKVLPNNLFSIQYLTPKPGVKFILYGIFRSSFNKEIDSFSQIILKKLNIDFKDNKNSIKEAFSNYYSWYKNGQQILSKYQSLNSILIVSWYHMDTMGLITAARQLKIDTYDLQHGKQGQYQAMYSGWESIRVVGSYLNLPNYFLNWNKYSQDNIAKSFLKRQDHKPLLFFNPEIYWDYISYPKILEDNKYNERRLLFIAPIQEGEIIDILPIEKLISLISDFPFELSIKIRFHPNTPKKLVKKNIFRIKKIAPKLKNIKIIISNENELFLSELRWCTHLLTFYSTCCLEANKCNKGVCILGIDSKRIYSELIDNERFIWLKQLDLKNKPYFYKWLCELFPSKDLSETFPLNVNEIKNKLKILLNNSNS